MTTIRALAHDAHLDSTPVNLLWTGGWDSTFRLMSLLFEYRRAVQPHYIIDAARATTQRELGAMAIVAEAIAATSQAHLLLPTIFIETKDIASDPAVTDKYIRLQRLAPIGSQFEYLARLASCISKGNIELCIEKGARSRQIYDLLSPYIMADYNSPVPRFRLKEDVPDPISLFADFRFPVIEMTKLEMEAAARRAGFSSIMEKTWTCHQPIFGRWPCGFCGSCKTTIMEGMQHRIGWIGILTYHTWGRIRALFPPRLRRRLRDALVRPLP